MAKRTVKAWAVIGERWEDDDATGRMATTEAGAWIDFGAQSQWAIDSYRKSGYRAVRCTITYEDGRKGKP